MPRPTDGLSRSRYRHQPSSSPPTRRRRRHHRAYLLISLRFYTLSIHRSIFDKRNRYVFFPMTVFLYISEVCATSWEVAVPAVQVSRLGGEEVLVNIGGGIIRPTYIECEEIVSTWTMDSSPHRVSCNSLPNRCQSSLWLSSCMSEFRTS